MARTPIADAAPLTFGYLCDGKLIAKSIKDKRLCKDVQGNASVSVAPLEVSANERLRNNAYGYAPPCAGLR